MTTSQKRKYLTEYCEHQGTSDQCEGCVLVKEASCQFNKLDREKINEMYEKVRSKEDENNN